MRTRRFANNEKIRSKERRLLEVLRRKEQARTLSMLPKGVLGQLSHSTPLGGTSITINTPLLALVQTSQEIWQVDFDTVPDSTGGFGDVTIEAGKQIAELASQQVFSLTGQPVGNYVIYATHSPSNENPETRNPPGKYAGGTGVFTEHATFFGHGQTIGDPIPREGYDDTLTPEVTSEHIDRLSINYAAEASVPANATKLLLVVWNGSSITSTAILATTLDLQQLYDHIGSGGNAHAVATSALAGFLSAADKAKLDNATNAATASRLAMRDSGGRMRSAAPVASDDVARKQEVDALADDLGEHVGAGGTAHAVATGSLAGFLSATDKSKLDQMAPPARQVFTASGTWSKPGVGSMAFVEMWGGGGGGGDDGGGGGGGYVNFFIPLASLSSSVTVTVGAGGIARPSPGQPGGDGGATSFGPYSVTGGKGGSAAVDLPANGGGVDGGKYLNNEWHPPGPWGGGAGSHTGAGQGGGQGAAYGGGGGGGVGGSQGSSTFGGNGGAAGSSGVAPAGGGGTVAAGARGEVRVTVF